MSMKQETRLLMGLSSMAGLIFCLANAMGADLLCITEGCRIYQEYTLLGINFYVLGALGFFYLLFYSFCSSPVGSRWASCCVSSLPWDC